LNGAWHRCSLAGWGALGGGGRPAASSRFVGLGRASPPALPTHARVRLQRLSPIGNRRNPPPRAEKAANFFRSSASAREKTGTDLSATRSKSPRYRQKSKCDKNLLPQASFRHSTTRCAAPP